VGGDPTDPGNLWPEPRYPAGAGALNPGVRHGSDVMPARNRVTPLGDIDAIPLRGAWTGNRGILHFRASYNAYRTAWAEGLGLDLPSATQMNQQLHGERIVRSTHRRRTHEMEWGTCPRARLSCSTTRPPCRWRPPGLVVDRGGIQGTTATADAGKRKGHHPALDGRRVARPIPRSDRRCRVQVSGRSGCQLRQHTGPWPSRRCANLPWLDSRRDDPRPLSTDHLT
jgi:hypothetical protein